MNIMSDMKVVWAILRPASICRRSISTKGAPGGVLHIGDVSGRIRTPRRAELVPAGYAGGGPLPQSVLGHLRWLVQKDALGQDVFLIGPPGSGKRRLVMAYLELCGREYEYLALTRDTTEADIKQRREIRAGSALYSDLCAVRAALEGRVLVLDGIEKAERNVLPILNNLLENREIALDDGRFLMAPPKFDALLKDHSLAELEGWGLRRVSPDFHVVALGLPTPAFRGHSLDPPLRSRFQAREVPAAAFSEAFAAAQAVAGGAVDSDRLSALLAFAYGVSGPESAALALPHFPLDNLRVAARLWALSPNQTAEEIIRKLYPFRAMLKPEAAQSVTTALQTFAVADDPGSAQTTLTASVDKGETAGAATVNSSSGSFQVHAGSLKSEEPALEYVENAEQERVLAGMLTSHAVMDFCLVGPKGCGKSTLVSEFARRLHYPVTTVMMYQDMTGRDLVQRRGMRESGETVWEDTPLVHGLQSGALVVLDGVHRLHHSTLNLLQRLIHDRDLELFDGSRYVGRERFEALKAQTGLSDTQLASRAIFPIHAAFRLIALAEPVSPGESSGWLTPELMSAFLFHEVRALSAGTETAVVSARSPGLELWTLERLVGLVGSLRSSGDPNVASLGNSLSTRQLLRIARRLAAYPDESLYEAVHKACLSRFMPSLSRETLNTALSEAGIHKPEDPESRDAEITYGTDDGVLRIGRTSAPVYKAANASMIPDILFHDNPQQLHVLEGMLRDWVGGDHLLLVGNQGVGKNKLADRFLQLLGRPRHYVQLHRDTTVQTLTVQATVRDGVLRHEDSPLVKAVKEGAVLVVDEGDKAPTHVTAILKSLLESHHMDLADGRRIVPFTDSPHESEIPVAPGFRVIVLANRPGFPFLGNDFYAALGDQFACTAVDNPSRASELRLLRKFGPDVPLLIVEKLLGAFADLRELADDGLIQYPYSTRELVNIVKHLQKFPTDPLPAVIRNVFDFDQFSKDSKETLGEVLQKHGIPFGLAHRSPTTKLAIRYPLPAVEVLGDWGPTGEQIELRTETRPLIFQDAVRYRFGETRLERLDGRCGSFGEEVASWQVPLSDVDMVSDVKFWGSKDGEVGVLTTVNPLGAHLFFPASGVVRSLGLHQMLPSPGSYYQPRLRATPLRGELDGQVLLQEELSGAMVLLDTTAGELQLLGSAARSPGIVERMTKTVGQRRAAQDEPFWRLLPDSAREDGTLWAFHRGGRGVQQMDLLRGQSRSLNLDNSMAPIRNAAAAEGRVILFLEDGSTWEASLAGAESGQLRLVSPSPSAGGSLQLSSPLPKETSNSLFSHLTPAPHPAALISGDPQHLAAASIGWPAEALGKGKAVAWIRESGEGTLQSEVPFWVHPKALDMIHPNSQAVFLPSSSQIVRALPPWEAPPKALPTDVDASSVSGFLEVVDLISSSASYLPVPRPKFSANRYPSWLCSLSATQFVVCGNASGEGVFTADANGGIRQWETSTGSLRASQSGWERMLGGGEGDPLELSIQRPDGGLDKLTEPKHGQVDPTGNPHVGGGTWAGGTGGFNTAGLGGVGGPYRLDAGHQVHQAPEHLKEQVPEHIREKAREMGRRAYAARLEEIRMGEHDASAYEKIYSRVEKQIGLLRVILDSLQAKGKERQWVRHQTSGDVDEGKLVEGVTGEKAVYRRRAVREPEPGSPQAKPKRISLLLDVSGSMYRFNGHDARLQKSLEATLMVMEALHGYEDKIKYSLIGHSGEESAVDLGVTDKLPPKNEKERLDVLKRMLAHSQFCMSGDHTLEATKAAVEALAKEDADERFVVVVSDANLERYGIRPGSLARLMKSDPKVAVFAVFIGSLGDQAERLKAALPAGQAFVCQDSAQIPQILQQIFATAVLSSAHDEE